MGLISKKILDLSFHVASSLRFGYEKIRWLCMIQELKKILDPDAESEKLLQEVLAFLPPIDLVSAQSCHIRARLGILHLRLGYEKEAEKFMQGAWDANRISFLLSSQETLYFKLVHHLLAKQITQANELFSSVPETSFYFLQKEIFLEFFQINLQTPPKETTEKFCVDLKKIWFRNHYDFLCPQHQNKDEEILCASLNFLKKDGEEDLKKAFSTIKAAGNPEKKLFFLMQTLESPHRDHPLFSVLLDDLQKSHDLVIETLKTLGKYKGKILLLNRILDFSIKAGIVLFAILLWFFVQKFL